MPPPLVHRCAGGLERQHPRLIHWSWQERVNWQFARRGSILRLNANGWLPATRSFGLQRRYCLLVGVLTCSRNQLLKAGKIHRAGYQFISDDKAGSRLYANGGGEPLVLRQDGLDFFGAHIGFSLATSSPSFLAMSSMAAGVIGPLRLMSS